MIRSLAASLIIMLAFGSLAQHWSSGALAQEPGLEGAYRQFVAAINEGDVDGALALMADDAQLVGTPGCLAAPCVGLEAIGADLQADAEAGLQIQILGTVYVSGNVVTAQTAHRADLLQGLGLSRAIINETVTFDDGKIASVVYAPETADAQTAELVAILTAGPPAEESEEEPAEIVPPATGDGGLLP